jgi:hypothetical protein
MPRAEQAAFRAEEAGAREKRDGEGIAGSGLSATAAEERGKKDLVDKGLR